jgi:hypothetical protein
LRFLEVTVVSGTFDSVVGGRFTGGLDVVTGCSVEISMALFFSGGDSLSGVPGMAVFSRLRFGCLVLASVGVGASGPISGDRPLNLVNSSLVIPLFSGFEVPGDFGASLEGWPLSRWCEIGEVVLREESEGVAYAFTESNESRLAVSGNCVRAKGVSEDEMRRLRLEPSSDMITLAVLRSSNTSNNW